MSFPIYLDEHINQLVAVLLRQDGFDVVTTHDARNRGLSDEEQLRFAGSQGRAILTHDTYDYGLLAHKWAEKREHHAGIILCNARTPHQIKAGMLLLQSQYPGGIEDLTLRLPRA